MHDMYYIFCRWYVNMLCQSDFSNMKREEKVCRRKNYHTSYWLLPPIYFYMSDCKSNSWSYCTLDPRCTQVCLAHTMRVTWTHVIEIPIKWASPGKSKFSPFLGLLHLEALWTEAPKRAIHLREDAPPALHNLARVCWVLGVYWSDVRLEEKDQHVFRRIFTSTESVEVFRRGRSSLNTALHCNFKQIFMD